MVPTTCVASIGGVAVSSECVDKCGSVEGSSEDKAGRYTLAFLARTLTSS